MLSLTYNFGCVSVYNPKISRSNLVSFLEYDGLKQVTIERNGAVNLKAGFILTKGERVIIKDA